MTKRWAEADLRFLRDNAGKMDVQSLADRLGATLGEIEAKIEKLGLVSENGSGNSIKKPASFREMFKHSEAARKEYEKGAAALQKKKFEDAEKHFRAVIEEFGDEKELADRSRLYLAVCERRKKNGKATGSSDGEDPYYAALLEKNRKNFQGAIEQLKKSRKSDDGRVSYLLACCFAQLNDAERAVEALERAIAEDESNRALARRDPDFEPVRERAEFLNLTAATA
jgi:tetratricopeptide (TPR) repeat protein